MSLRIDFGRLASESAREIELAGARGDGARCREPVERIAAEHDVDRHRLVLLEIFLLVNVAVLAGTDVDAGAVTILQHDAVGADVYPIRIGIFGDDQVAGADITAAVFFVQQRRGKIEEVDLCAFLGVFVYRAARYFRHGDWRTMFHFFMIGAGEFQHVVEVFAGAQGERDAFR